MRISRRPVKTTRLTSSCIPFICIFLLLFSSCEFVENGIGVDGRDLVQINTAYGQLAAAVTVRMSACTSSNGPYQSGYYGYPGWMACGSESNQDANEYAWRKDVDNCVAFILAIPCPPTGSVLAASFDGIPDSCNFNRVVFFNKVKPLEGTIIPLRSYKLARGCL